jgi:hypothetical protein
VSLWAFVRGRIAQQAQPQEQDPEGQVQEEFLRLARAHLDNQWLLDPPRRD